MKTEISIETTPGCGFTLVTEKNNSEIFNRIKEMLIRNKYSFEYKNPNVENSNGWNRENLSFLDGWLTKSSFYFKDSAYNYDFSNKEVPYVKFSENEIDIRFRGSLNEFVSWTYTLEIKS